MRSPQAFALPLVSSPAQAHAKAHSSASTFDVAAADAVASFVMPFLHDSFEASQSFHEVVLGVHPVILPLHVTVKP